MHEEFRFFSFNKQTDWKKGISHNLTIDDRGLSIKQTKKYSLDHTIFMGDHVSLAPIFDFAVGDNDRMYLLDESSTVWTFDYRNNVLEKLLDKESEHFSNHSILASINDFLFIADPTGRLYTYSLKNNQIFWTRSTWDDRPIYPLAINIQLTTGYLYILVPLQVDHERKMIKENSSFVVLKINIAGEVIDVLQNESFKFTDNIPLLQARHRFILMVLNNSSAYIFDKETSDMYLFSKNEDQSVFHVQTSKTYSSCCLDSNHFFYFGNNERWDVVGENDRYLLQFNPRNNEETVITSYRGRVDQMHIDKDDRIFIWDREQERFSILTLKTRTMVRKPSNFMEGVFISTSLDTTVDKTRWHKVLIDAQIPRETQLTISYFSADSKNIVIDGKHVNIDQLIKDETIPFVEKERMLAPLFSQERINPKDALFFQLEGRYLWFRLRLTGSETETPLLKKMRIYFPRMSYLSYLPAIFQEDSKSSEFLERYLSLYAKFLSEMDEQIQSIPRFFDPNLVSGDYLRWLSKWLGIVTDDSWTDEQLRELIRHAPFIYKKRGTKEAIAKVIEIYTGEKPFIVEHFQLEVYKQDATLYEVIKKLYGDHPYYFYVIVNAETIDSEKKRIIVQSILDEEKPAFTEAKLIILEPWIYLDSHSYLGINTYLSERSVMTLDNKSYLPTDTVLIDKDRDTRMDVNSQMATDSRLK